MYNYQLNAPYEPKGDQPSAIKSLVDGLNTGEKFQTLLGATGTVSYTHLTLPTTVRV